ncbi:MAG: DUF2851 family protein [Saprospiraceae bacterium]|nr:DUF2851 family protein [Saprospiraceae bacterium]MCB9324634.1 DUF2851 family protein [Lewinellaceae bacterium]
MKEEFLHYLWRLRRFDLKEMKTTEGESISIISTGILNHDGGPDFMDARIRIGDTLWAGNVEIHINASDWSLHSHQKNRAYDNVILHVVYEEDRPVFHPTGERIPCLELRRRIKPRVFKMYEKLMSSEKWIPCQFHFHEAPEITRKLWLDRLMVERLENRYETIAAILESNKNNWEETFYQCLAHGFGLKVNTEPFEQLARNLPLLTLSKHRSQLFQIEALLFGQAGFLGFDFAEDYPNKLKKEYSFLKEKYDLTPMSSASWKFLRMRPANFPSIRIAQLAMLIFQTTHLFSKIMAASKVEEIENALTVYTSSYWESHYVFDKPTEMKRRKGLGKPAIQLIIINIIAPLLFLYGKQKADEKYKEKAFKLLEQIKPEQNKIIRQWQELGMKPESAYQTQALLQLKNKYCDAKRCADCAIGNAIFGNL